jgi:hypothetical protein
MLSVRFREPLTRLIGASMMVSMASLLLSCGTNPPPTPKSNPIDETSSALGVQLKMRAPARFVSNEPDYVIFARLEEGVPLTETYDLYSSTFAHDGHVYLMNVEPGTYVAVAAVYEYTKTPPINPNDPDADRPVTVEVVRNYFSCELIEQTRTEVRPNSFAFMGQIVADQSMKFGEGGTCQRFFMESIEENRSGLSKFFSGEKSVRLDPHERDVSKAAKREFLEVAKTHFAKTGWTRLIDSELSGMR